jgi:hypothetical protein
MLTNYLLWAEKRKDEIRTVADGTTPEKREEEVKKLDDRMSKFKDKMGYLNGLAEVKRKNSASSINLN